MVTNRWGVDGQGPRELVPETRLGGQQTYDLTHGGRRLMELGWIGDLEQEERKGEQQTEATGEREGDENEEEDGKKLG